MAWALAAYQYLTARGFDVFFDYLSIPSGDFESVIIENIKGRAHFLVVLTPSALQRCEEPGDWLRREIETAIEEKRNIVPLLVESFDFGSPLAVKSLTGRLAELRKYQGLNVPSEYFFEAMERLEKRYLQVPLETVLHPISLTTLQVTEENKSAARQEAQDVTAELTEQNWYEKAFISFVNSDYEEAIRLASLAIQVKANLHAFTLRGLSHSSLGEIEDAIQDFSSAIDLDPKVDQSYFSRGWAYRALGYWDKARQDFQKALSINPRSARAHNGLAEVYVRFENLDKAMHHLQIACELDPSDAFGGLVSLGVLARNKGLAQSHQYFSQALKLIESYPNQNLSKSHLLENIGMAMLCLGQTTEALKLFRESMSHRTKDDSSNLMFYELLMQSNDPPTGLSEAVEILDWN